MNINVTQSIIKDRCGVVSFKRGTAFYQTNKVVIQYRTNQECSAIVKGAEDFHVRVEADGKGGFKTSCTCPTLASVRKECQHVAAVLLALSDQKHQQKEIPEQTMSADVQQLFLNGTKLKSRKQLHFETRQVLKSIFTLESVEAAPGKMMFGIGVQIGQAPIENIRLFLEQVQNGTRIPEAAYDPTLHCFEKETDDVLQLLIKVLDDEKALLGTSFVKNGPTMLIPPSAWLQLVPLLESSQDVKLIYNGNERNGFHIAKGPLPLSIDLSETGEGVHVLTIEGMDKLLFMEPYHVVLAEGRLVQLTREEAATLGELKELVESSVSKRIPVPADQTVYFQEKIIPALRNFGTIQVQEALSAYERQPLVAKLYLDRVKNRLLAGLEFHYGQHIIDPLDSKGMDSSPGVIRNRVKEHEILEMMEESSFAKTEGGYFLHNEELEYEFLYHMLPRLQKLTQVYATTSVRNRIFRENLQPRINVKIKKERTNWLEFKFELTGISEQEIKNVLAALEVKRKYYRLKDGALLSLETREFEEIQRFLAAGPVQPLDLEAGLNLPLLEGLRMLDRADDESVFQFEESFRSFLDMAGSEINYPLPPSLEPILRDYQAKGFQWMKRLAEYGFGGILADDMGLGKTLQSIAFILSVLPEIRMNKMPALIVCPAAVTYNWLHEFLTFAPDINAIVIDGNKSQREKLGASLGEVDVIITTYTLLRKDLHWYETSPFHSVFFDEAQAFKNPTTQTFRAVKKITANHKFALTGTPIENSIEELWAIFHIVFPELFRGLKEYSHLTRKQIARRIQPFMLRRLKEDVLSELPEKIETVESIELLPDQKKLYAAYLSKLRLKTLKHLDKETIRKNRIKILAGLTRLRQICCHPGLFVENYQGRSAKFDQLIELVDECRQSGRRVLIFSQFTKMLELIRREFIIQGLPFFYLDGQTPSEERVDVCNRFNEGERDFFLISLKAGGTGLNLAGADTVILYDLWWNPAVEEQAADRAHRMGQQNTVQVIKLVTRGTIEEKMNELQEKKRHLVEELIDNGEKGQTTLTEEDIREILSM
ncbi:helicase SNF [Bacillus sp. FJAT-27225]|uniref:DEAD/DEAH box helicase n=1 Tax=Bacillus sp. FJAT-27225 TaxID=1743144 RepID=UPI00080C279D|nr:DEAD/DEAH box helicase [Bacillus sp. FJAT-27225]OCA85688.1 helicase SNF [Bacillus sp. FJAT-27225]